MAVKQFDIVTRYYFPSFGITYPEVNRITSSDFMWL